MGIITVFRGTIHIKGRQESKKNDFAFVFALDLTCIYYCKFLRYKAS